MSVLLNTTSELSALLPELGSAASGVQISDVTLDSRNVQRGALFLAFQGRSTHGLQHVAKAISLGARAVLYEPAAGLKVPDFPSEIFVAAVADLAARAGGIADQFFGRPSAALTVAGITGTNGKTTCAWLLANALHHCGRPAGYMGTLGVGLMGARDALHAATHTTADVVTVHRTLAQLRQAGAQCVAMEVSSHALDQGRIDGVRLRAAGFTNLTRDHLDYHLSMDAYGAAKAKLFGWPALGARIVNVDDEFGAMLARSAVGAARLIVTSRGHTSASLAHASLPANAEPLLASAVVADAAGLGFSLSVDGVPHAVKLPLIGEFNVDNVLTVLGLLRALDVPLEQAIRALADCRAPSGRMETFVAPGSALVIVDYAHTPDALLKALQAAHAHCKGRLRIVFGCGGDRDRGKRPQMAQAAASAADEIVLTDDNPRSEPPARIVADIVGGLPQRAAFSIIHDRATAIRQTLAQSAAGDVVLIAGKGHEDYQIYGNEKRPFSDQAIVREALGIGA